MKKIYQYPETEIVFVGLSKLIMGGDNGPGEESGKIGNGDDGPGILTNENNIFEDDTQTGKSSLWD